MPAHSLNHYTIKVRDLERTKDFYQDIVGLTVGDRPPLNFPGYWLYCGDVPTVHLIGYRAEDPVIADGLSDPAPTGRLDHIAFSCNGLKEMRENLKSHGIKFDERVLPRLNMTQLFYLDPDGISVECNFDAVETETLGMKGYQARFVLNLPYCVLNLPYCVLNLPYCVLRLPQCVPSLPQCVPSLRVITGLGRLKQRLEEVLGAFTYGGRRKAQALLNPEDRDRRWSNDRFLSTPHGVINESGTDRYSIAYFHSPNPASTIECLPSCVSTENPARYPPAAYRDLVLEFYRKNYFHQKGYKSEAVEQPNA